MERLNPKLSAKLDKVRVLARTGQGIAALKLLDEIAGKVPRNAEIWFMRGVVLGQVNRLEEASAALRRAVALRPKHGLGYFNLGNVLMGLGRPAEAADAFEKALHLEPSRPEIAHRLAGARLQASDYRGAAEAFHRCLRHDPHSAQTHAKLGACYFYLGELEASAAHYRKAVDLEPVAAHFDGLGAALCQQGKYEEAVQAHHEALKRDPGNTRFHSNYLLTLNYLPDASPEAVTMEHRKWAEVHSRQPRADHKNDTDPSRRIRVGYVSPDFRNHSVAYFFEPLLSHHDKNLVESFCYACSPQRDEVTARLQSAADHWCDISGMSDEQASSKILSDEVDILVDLAGHTARNRLPLFFLRPAPVQVTYLGYPNTTGMSVMDYRITDSVADPAGSEIYCTEKLLHTPGCFLSYSPPPDAPPVVSGPHEADGFITFGSFNNLAKINDGVVALWSALLEVVPSSRLVIKNPSLTDRETANLYRAMFERHGVPAECVDLLGLAPTTRDHLASYALMDIALDTFPYNGTTTTCEALYMGVPVITVCGETHAGRVGWSLLCAAGLEKFIAKDVSGYLEIAASLAANKAELVALRRSLRDRVCHSPLTDGRRLAAQVEMLYREIWRQWCATVTGR